MCTLELDYRKRRSFDSFLENIKVYLASLVLRMQNETRFLVARQPTGKGRDFYVTDKKFNLNS